MKHNNNTTTPPFGGVTTANHRLTRQLAFARRVSGQLQEDVAARVGVTRQAISSWELADGDVTLSTLEKWARLFNMRVTLEPGATDPVLVDHTGRPASERTLSMHGVVTGPNRELVIAALAADCAGRPVFSLGGLVGERLDGPETADLLAAVEAGEAHPAVVVTEFRDTAAWVEMIHGLLARARMNGVSVLIGAETEAVISAQLMHNVALELRTSSDGSIVDRDGNHWSLKGC